MKKLMSVMIGLGLMLGTVSMFAQEKKADEQKTEKGKDSKKKKKKAEQKPAA